MHDLLSGSNAGVLVPVDDVAATAAAIRSLVTDPERRHALGAAARDHVLSHFTWDRIARRYLEMAGR
jgi:glycosyltransferase involved in cell wall biosynthesis